MAKAKKKRIYEYAKELGLSTNDLLRKLKFMGVRVDNIFNAVDDEAINQVKRQMGLHLFEEPEEEFIDSPPKPRSEDDPEYEEPRQKPVAPRPVPPPERKPVAPAAAPPPPAPKAPEHKTAPAEARPESKPVQKPQVQAVKPPVQQAPKIEDAPDIPPELAEPEVIVPALKLEIDKKDKIKKLGGPKFPKTDVEKKEKPVDMYASPAKRLDAIKQKGLQKDRRGITKTTFIKKRSKKERGAGQTEEEQKPVLRKRIRVSGPMTVRELAHELGAKSSDIIMYLMKELQLMTTLNQSLDLDIIKLVADSYECKVFHDIKDAGPETEEELAAIHEEEEAGEKIERAPVVTVLGHVDHGKTKLLDAIRHTDVTATEFGGITQHIGAYQITHNGRKITFLDTPGHAAFTQLRARGAKVTDLAVLVVAADDGVMPQTIEAIDHARDAKVPILVAINKIDKPQANPDRVRQMLSDKGLVPENWGGDTVFVEVSALQKQGIEDLLDMVFLVTDIMELKASPKRRAIGTVIEAKLDKGKGPVATVLVQNGTLNVGDYMVAGRTYGKARALENDLGERVQSAFASMPVEVHGLHEMPEAGDQFFAIEDEKTAREIAAKREFKNREEKMKYESRITLEDLFIRMKSGSLQELKVVLKGDVQGSVEAIVQALEGIKHEQVRVNVIRVAAGDVNETDIMLAAAANAIVVAYNVNVIPDARARANSEKVEIRFYDIIYKLIDDVKLAMAGMLAPEFDEHFSGRAEVRQTFASSKFGNIAGCMVTEGELKTGMIARLIRGGNEILKTKVSSLRRFKDSVKSVAQGYECGVTLEGFEAYEEGDQIEVYSLIQKEREII
ncbi:MAG TPA: translation initiation factor IF-2 [bacterium]|nr:translation initiation factor IF-2 [bacterium]